VEPRTHLGIDPTLCGRPVLLEPGRAAVELATRPEMAADERGLVHGGFVFGLADYAAMLAVNDPFVVLGSAETRFERPVVAGETLRAEARLESSQGKKRLVTVEVTRGGEAVLNGRFTCFVLAKHVLER
jgi:acyl-coenzyme A thioesterase PaaI-like protein